MPQASITNSIITTTMLLTTLNTTIILHILSFLPLASYKPLILTCRQFNNLITNSQPLLQSWCISKFPKHITATTPLPNDADYNWLIKCLINDLNDVQDSNTHKYGYTRRLNKLFIRSIIRTSTHPSTVYKHIPIVIAQGIRIKVSGGRCRIGTFVNDKLQGQGSCITYLSTYVGEFEDGCYHGLGTLTQHNNESYHGYFCNRLKSGLGTCKYEDGSYYVGQWEKDMIQGHGSYHWPNGDSYVGQFHKNSFNGLGKFSRCIDAQVTIAYFGMWDFGVPFDCEFGYMYHVCVTCNVKVCDKCIELHRQCRSRKVWTIDATMILSCNHEKQELSKIK
ncbi:Hypothetical protein MVR_LOCUS40 [uncultured virus]|nr:Hypothetical protein MVR_LOCUS40 [uncultured virus]